MPARSIALLAALLAFAGVSIAAAATLRGDSAGTPTRQATIDGYAPIKPQLAQQRIDLQFLLPHARLHDDAELGDELAALARGSEEQAAALSALPAPPSIAGLVEVLQSAVAEQSATLCQVARRARADGPPAVRAATAQLLAQTERILAARRRLETSFVIGS